MQLDPPRRDDTLTRPGGRLLAWSQFGADDGWALFAFHGTPSSRLGMAALHDAAVAKGVCIVAPDRPGIGASDPWADFTLLDWPAEVSAIADHLDLDRYAVLGVSGGGPYALACGVEPDPRLVLIAGSGCPAPYDRVDATVGVTPTDRAVEVLAGLAPAVSRLILSAMGWSARRFPTISWRSWETELAASDRQALETVPIVQRLQPFTEALRAGPAGSTDDYRLLAGEWGFLPEEVAVPTVLWHGACDPTVPLHHGQDLATRLPTSELIVVPGAGHMLTVSHPDDLVSGIARRCNR